VGQAVSPANLSLHIYVRLSERSRHLLWWAGDFARRPELPGMPDYRRRLPHFHPAGAYMFLTWRLWGTLPARLGSIDLPPAGGTACPTPTFRDAFVVRDRALDRCSSGPLWLRNADVANLVAEAILIGENERCFYALCAWVVMPNHVHLLILPQVAVQVLMRWLKGSTARRANQILGRTGQPFWQDESFDHYPRNARQIDRIATYIERNPVSAGLARSAEGWPWSSAGWLGSGAGRQAEPPAPPE